MSYCASCDGFFYRNREVYVVGGGNSAGEEALHLAELAQQVHMLVRKDNLRCEAAIARRLELFQKQRTVLEARMAELQQTMDTLDYKCWFYETAAARGSTEGISDLPDAALPEALRPVRERLRAAADAETEEV